MTINLVQGDTGPQIKTTMTREDTGSAQDLTGATIKMHFRKKHTKTLLFSVDNSAGDDDLDDGICIFTFTAGQLDLDAGYYEGEVEVVFSGGTRETIYEKIEFYLREDFA